MSKKLAAALEANAIDRAGGIENYRRWQREGYADMLKRLTPDLENESGQVLAEEDAIRLTASEGACYAYPGADQAAERTAFCDGAVYAITGKLPPGTTS